MGMKPPQQTAPLRDYQVKAVFLYNFTQFVEWPPDAFSEPGSPLVIGVLGKDPFGSFLDETVAGDTINGHPLVVQRFTNADEVKTCHILFINESDKDRLENILEQLKGRSILTVGDATVFAREGGMIRFFTEDRKTRLLINLEPAKKADLTISSKLLRVAEVIPEKNN
jgi:hypothetical protein